MWGVAHGRPIWENLNHNVILSAFPLESNITPASAQVNVKINSQGLNVRVSMSKPEHGKTATRDGADDTQAVGNSPASHCLHHCTSTLKRKVFMFRLRCEWQWLPTVILLGVLFCSCVFMNKLVDDQWDKICFGSSYLELHLWQVSTQLYLPSSSGACCMVSWSFHLQQFWVLENFLCIKPKCDSWCSLLLWGLHRRSLLSFLRHFL